MRIKYLVLLFGIGLFCSGAFSQEQGGEEKIKKIFSKIETSEISKVWTLAQPLKEMEEQLLPYIEKNYGQASPKSRLVFARFLFQAGRHRSGLALTRKLIFSSRVDINIRMLALRLLERFAKGEGDAAGLSDLLEKPSASAFFKIQIAKVMRKVGHEPKGSRFLKKYLKSSDFSIRSQAAVALAEIGNPSFLVRQILNQLADDPTPQGLYARALLDQIKLMDSLSQTQGLSTKMQIKALEEKIQNLKRQNKTLELKLETGINTGKALLDEIMDKIERYYDYRKPGEIDKKAMVEAAAKGIMNSLDPHSVYFNSEETKGFQESMSSKYPGIGAYIQKAPNGYLKISQPIYSGPAYKAGLRSGDLVTEIFLEKKWIKTNEFKISELVSKLRGPAGSAIRLKIWRKNWKAPKEYSILRQFVKIPFVYTTLLPGEVGYLQLTSFGNQCVEEFEKGLRKLEGQGMKGLVLDLRNNPGGLLRAAVEISDKFLKGEKLIVYSQGRNPLKAPRKEYRSTNSATHPDFPVVVLVNGNSASASEILAGALKIHKRAILVGSQTYGKGSVQELMPLRSTSNKALIKLTIAKYYLPDGTNIDGKGIEADVKARLIQPEISIEKYTDLIKQEALEKYLDQYCEKHKKLFGKLARFDNHDASQYPHFEELYKNLKTNISKELVRRALRYKIRLKVADEVGHILVGDFQEDSQLQVALGQILHKMGLSPDSIPAYKKIKKVGVK